MDNITHALVGVALAGSGLRKATPLATATLFVAANLPDVDAVTLLTGEHYEYGFRRGWTHGLAAVALWPFVLTALVLAWDRWVRRRRNPAAEPARPAALLWLSALALATHVFLDYLNTYGMRWLMPFRDVWSYGDTLEIVDPWIWLALGLGWYWSRRRRKRGEPRAGRPAGWALALVAAYIAAMATSGLAARALAHRQLARAGQTVGRLMAGPVLVNPFRRRIVADVGTGYALATVDWLRRPAFALDSAGFVSRGDDQFGVAALARTKGGADFLRWARFPFFLVERGRGSPVVYAVDARYTLNPRAGFGALSVTLPQAIPSSGVSANQERHP
jgi:inner membrane protein